jgi:hypothetical protein
MGTRCEASFSDSGRARTMNTKKRKKEQSSNKNGKKRPYRVPSGQHLAKK